MSSLLQELQWNPFIVDTIGNPYSKVSLAQASGIFLVGVVSVCIIGLLSTMGLGFSLLYSGGEGQAEASITSNSAIELLTPVDNLAEKVDK